MTTKLRIAVGECDLTVQQLQQFLKLSGGYVEEVESALNSAIVKVEDMLNMSLRENTIELCTNSGTSGVVDLFLQPATEVVSVKAIETGEDIEYTSNSLLKTIKTTPMTEVQVMYKTKPVPKVDNYKNGVFAVAALIFNGNTDTTQFWTVLRKYV